VVASSSGSGKTDELSSFVTTTHKAWSNRFVIDLTLSLKNKKIFVGTEILGF
jgi:hypothetical protein